VRIDCSLCGVKMLDLDLCLCASVNVRYILHTQPLGLYNKDLVWKSTHPSLSLSILAGLPFSPSIPFDIVACYLFTSPRLFFFYLIHPYSSDGKRQNLQHQWPQQQQRQEATMSRVVVGLTHSPFGDLGATTTCQSNDATYRRKIPVKKNEE
jgi:hypothetical protein